MSCCAKKSSTRDCPFVNAKKINPGVGTEYPKGVFWSKTPFTITCSHSYNGIFDGIFDHIVDGYFCYNVDTLVTFVTDDAEVWYAPIFPSETIPKTKIESGVRINIGDVICIDNFFPLILEDDDTGELRPYMYVNRHDNIRILEPGVVAECNRAEGYIYNRSCYLF